MNKLEGPRLRRVLEQTDARLEQHLRTLEEAQQFLAKAAADKPFLLIDASLGRAARTLRRTTERLRSGDDGWNKLVDLYIDKLFGGNLPVDTLDIFRRFLGRGVEVVRSDPHNSLLPDDRFAAVGFTGSSANVSFGLDKFLRNDPVHEMDGLTHGRVSEVSGEAYRRAADLGLPVFGICFGHQRIGVERGGKIGRNEGTSGLGMIPVESSDYGNELLIGAVGRSLPTEAQVPGYHDEAITESGAQSAVIMRTSDRDPGKIYGMIHVADGNFTGDAEQDALLIRDTLSDGGHVAVTTQWHPEFEGFMPLMEFNATRDTDVLEQDYVPGMAANILEIIASVIEQHNG